jgi:hypothetical protein
MVGVHCIGRGEIGWVSSISAPLTTVNDDATFAREDAFTRRSSSHTRQLRTKTSQMGELFHRGRDIHG